MDRVAKLAAEAETCLRVEAEELAECAKESRKATREELERCARSLGFTNKEISAAIDTALAGR